MIIIIEGPDGAGKTTLADYLGKSMKFKVIHRSKPKNEAERKEMMDMYKKAIEEGENVIFDRAWYSEMVYGSIMRDKSFISIEQMLELEESLLAKGGLVIHCTTDVETLWERCQERGEEYVTTKETLAAIKYSFDALFKDMDHAEGLAIIEYGGDLDED